MTIHNKITGPESFLGNNSSNLVSFGSGQPDLSPPEEVLERVKNRESQRHRGTSAWLYWGALHCRAHGVELEVRSLD